MVGSQVSLDYTVRDWRWLVDERVLDQNPEADTDASLLPTSIANTRYVRLPVRNLENEPLEVFGLVWDYNSTTGQYSTQTVSPGSSGHASAEAGIIYYDANGLTAPRVRTVYQTIDDWTHQLSVAARSYTPFYPNSSFVGGRPNTAPREQWREYAMSSDNQYLCFHAGEAGKTVAVSYMAGGTIVNNRIISISAQIENGSGYGVNSDFYSGSNQVAVAKLPVAASILSVRGLDIRARTAWINGTNWTQTVLTGYRTR
jgi:hypothetical protein